MSFTSDDTHHVQFIGCSACGFTVAGLRLIDDGRRLRHVRVDAEEAWNQRRSPDKFIHPGQAAEDALKEARERIIQEKRAEFLRGEAARRLDLKRLVFRLRDAHEQIFIAGCLKYRPDGSPFLSVTVDIVNAQPGSPLVRLAPLED